MGFHSLRVANDCRVDDCYYPAKLEHYPRVLGWFYLVLLRVFANKYHSDIGFGLARTSS